MRKKLFSLAVLIGFVALNISYWDDPIFFRRWWDTLTHPDPAYENFYPTELVSGASETLIPVASLEDRTIEQAALDDAEAYAEEYKSFSMMVIHRGKIQAEWYNEGWDENSLTQSQSAHKTIVAILTGIAIDKGLITSVADPVEQYIEEWAGTLKGKITLYDLLTMSSGLEQMPFSLNPFRDKSAFKYLFSKDREAVVLSAEQLWPPQEKYDYNEMNPALLGLILERVSGQRYADFLNENLWQPLGNMPSEVWLDRKEGNAVVSCCLLIPTRNWARLGLLLKDGGRFNGQQIVSEDWVEDMIKASPTNTAYGYLTWRAEGVKAYTDKKRLKDPDNWTAHHAQDFADPDLFYYWGRGGQMVYISRKYDLIVLRTGPHSGRAPMKAGWDNTYLMNRMIEAIKPE
jgi:CubicO group peptidase (beta-lactamase class C family)